MRTPEWLIGAQTTFLTARGHQNAGTVPGRRYLPRADTRMGKSVPECVHRSRRRDIRPAPASCMYVHRAPPTLDNEEGRLRTGPPGSGKGPRGPAAAHREGEASQVSKKLEATEKPLGIPSKTTEIIANPL